MLDDNSDGGHMKIGATTLRHCLDEDNGSSSTSDPLLDFEGNPRRLKPTSSARPYPSTKAYAERTYVGLKSAGEFRLQASGAIPGTQYHTPARFGSENRSCSWPGREQRLQKLYASSKKCVSVPSRLNVWRFRCPRLHSCRVPETKRASHFEEFWVLRQYPVLLVRVRQQQYALLRFPNHS